MENSEMKKFTENLSAKIGDEASALISDDLAKLIIDNKAMNDKITEISNNLETEKNTNKNLINANASLLQQVGFSSEDPKEEQKEVAPQELSLKSCFDERGRFKK